MKLKKYILPAVAAGAMFGLSSCNDWLDYTPKDKQTYNQQFSTVAGYRTAVNGVYTNMSSSSLYGNYLSYGAIDVMGNLYQIPEKNQSYYDLVTANYSGQYGSGIMDGIWRSAYSNILNVNVLLKALDEFPEVLNSVDSRLIRAEMLAVRAYLHLDMTRLFGPSYNYGDKGEGLAVPFADNHEIVKRPRLTANEILTKHIIPDLAEAQEILKEVDPIMDGDLLDESAEIGDENGNWLRYRNLRLNYFAVTLLKARAHMWMLDYENALTEAKKITDDPLAQNLFPWIVPSKLLANTINPDRVFSTECLFGFYRSDLGNIYKNLFAGSLDATVTFQPVTGNIGKVFSNTGDYRRQSQWTISTGLYSDFEFIKYKGFTPLDPENPEFYATFFGLLRKSEAYLIAAEACAKTGLADDAVTYINALRKYRGETQYSKGTAADVIVKECRYEYVREFRGEGQIFFNHKRNYEGFGLTESIEMFQPSPFDGSGLTGDGWYSTPSRETRYFPPIPPSETY